MPKNSRTIITFLKTHLNLNFFKRSIKICGLPLGGLPLTLFTVALMVRIPWLWEIPRYVDELREVNLAYMIYLGKIFPLHNFAREIGAMHNYILAGIFSLFGPSAYWPRLYVAITSAATVVLVYYLGKRLFNRWTGLIAAGMLLTNGMHILVTHMAWSNCTTPFFFVLALLGTVIAGQKSSGTWLMGSALLWAMALQTHSSVLVYLLALVIYIFCRFRREAGIPRKYYFRSLLVFLAAYSNMIIYNALTGFDSIRSIFSKQYTLEPHPGITSFADNFARMFIELLRSVSSTYPSHPNPWQYLAYPQFVICLLLFGGGIYLALKTGGVKAKGLKSILVWMIGGGFLLIPWINHRYYFYIVTRYIMPIIICAILLIAYAASHLLKILVSKISSKTVFKTVFKTAGKRKILIPAAITLTILLSLQLLPFYQYCRQITHTDYSNHMSIEVLQIIQKYATRDKLTILLDKTLAAKDEPFPLLFKLSHLKFITISHGLTALQKHHSIAPGQKIIAVLTPPAYDRLKTMLPIAAESRLTRRLVLHKNPRDNSWRAIYIAKINGYKATIYNPPCMKYNE